MTGRVSLPSEPTAFDEHAERWRAYTSSPWGRLRYTLVARTLAGLGDELGAGPWRVLDVGGGDGLDAAPLVAAGHDVVVVDPSPALLAAGTSGAATVPGGLEDLADLPGHAAYDLVLCHFVLQYRADLGADLDRLVAAARPGGLLSLVAPNPPGMVLAALVRSGPRAALEQLAAPTARTVTFGTEVRKLGVDEVAAALRARGCDVVSHTGGRVANDLVADDSVKDDPEWYAALVDLEVALHDREPFRRTGAYWHLVVRTPV